MTESWQRRILYVAAAWNVVGGIAALVESPRQVAWIAVIAWGAAYLGAIFAPAARRVVVLAGGAGKLAYFAACVALFSQGAIDATLLAAGAADLVFVALFALIAFQRNLPVSRSRWNPTHARNAAAGATR